MDLKKFDKTLIVTNNKSYFLDLRNQNLYLDFKLITRNDLINKLTFSYDERVILYLTRKGYSYSNSEEILKNLILLRKGISKKVDELIKIKEELDKEKLLIYDQDFIKILKERKIFIHQENDDKVLNLLLGDYNYEYFYEKPKNELSCFMFDTFNEEISYLFEMVFSLLKNNISPKNIKIVCKDNLYRKILKKYQHLLKLHFFGLEEEKLYYCNDYHEFKKILEQNSLDIAYDQIVSKSKHGSAFEKLLQKYINVKKMIKNEEIISFFDYYAKNISLKEIHYENEIEICELNKVKKSDYVFVLGFNINSYPSIRKDDDYLSNNEKTSLGLITSYEQQEKDKLELINKLLSFENLYLSYSKKYLKKEYYKSSLMLELLIQEKTYLFNHKIYSQQYFDFVMGKVFDDERNYSYKDKYFKSCKKEDINYLIYTHKFKPFVYSLNKISLSHTSVKSFYQCQFKYYLNYILKADEFKANINSTIGNFAHLLLEKTAKKEEFDFDKELDFYQCDNKAKVFIMALKKVIIKAIDNLKEILTKTNFNNAIAENKFIYKINGDENTILEGKIDLILEDNNNHCIIVDYKTGNESFDEKLVGHGLSMQLPIYSLLYQNNNENEICGIYINHILNKDYYSDQTYKYLKLDGLTTNNIVPIQISTYVKESSCEVKEETYKKVVKRTEENLKLAINKILECEFTINPKQEKSKDHSCEYCNFYDVCFHDYFDTVFISKEEE